VNSSAREIELKLLGRPDEIAPLIEAPPLRAARRGEPVRMRLEAVYYDTPDRRLRQRGVSFRVRAGERGYVQTIKTEARAQGAGMDRREWETALTSPTPRPEAFTDPEARAALGLILPRELRSMFRTAIDRTACELEWPDGEGGAARVALAVDIGRIVAGRRELPVAEIELECIEGRERAIFDLAEQCGALATLRPSREAKSDRGWRLATGEPPPWRRSGKVELDGAASLDEGIRAILGSGLAHWLDNESAAADGRQSEGVHQMRVALRRLRSALSLFRPYLGEADRASFGDDLRRIVRALGPARDLDVLHEEVIGEPLQAMPGRQSLQALAGIVETERERAYEQVRQMIASPDYARAVLRFAVWIGRRGWRIQADPDRLAALAEPLEVHARRLLDKRRKAALKRGRDFASLDAVQRHELRIALKKLRYAGEFFVALYRRKATARYLARVADLQERLGRLNDASVAAGTLRALLDRHLGRADMADLALAAGEVVGWHGRAAALSEPELGAIWRRFVDAKPFWH
jgi:inorganic triphosphatase YgiF